MCLKPGWRDRGMVTGGGGLGQKPDWKKWPGLLDTNMVAAGLRKSFFDHISVLVTEKSSAL